MMKKRILFIALLSMAIAILSGVRLTPQKRYANQAPRQHPYIQFLNKQSQDPKSPKAKNYEKLLVILVDFQEETTDDPSTTGNGKFLLNADPDYLYTVGSPPHDRQYFLDNLEALKYYYLAASAGSYDLDYDVYPQSGAYTLPQSMGYYNPPGVGSDDFVSRMEEYFKSSFELADILSPEIDFSSYGHFMIVHAGSDWQHDVFGDTPSDIPSFFINVGAGKEAVVDQGQVMIGQACNVPSTISQDFRSQTGDGETYHSGYGALNAVIAHEFGHSLGFVDLYNVYNWQPMVGVFDIMDSGGSGVLVDVLDDGSYVLLEGALPVLPGAWSRSLAFGDDLSDSGLLKDIEQINLFSPQELAASSAKQEYPVKPEILRIPLSDTEYILVENRSVDPDNDGGTAVFATPDSRVILYPTPFDDPNNNPSYEYDYLLPSFQRADGSAVGGGLLVWRINDDVIYNQGVTDSEGNWVSNFANNTVNTRYNQRGVEIIEADNLPDIGYDWSWYWTGTQYEYFHARKPVLDGSGFFVNWSQDEWKPTLSATTLPPLADSDGSGALYWLSEIGNPSALMSLTPRAGFFSQTDVFASGEPGIITGPVLDSSFNNYDIPLIGEDSIRLLSRTGGEWADLMGPFPWTGQPVDHHIITTNQYPNGLKEMVMVHGDNLEIVEFAFDDLQSVSLNFTAPITTTPISIRDTLFVCTAGELSSIRSNEILETVPLAGIRKLGSFGQDLVALCTDIAYLIDTRDLFIKVGIELPEIFGVYEPVSVSTSIGDRMLFLMADSGNLYKYEYAQLRLIHASSGADKPTQMGISSISTGSSTSIRPVLFWGQGNRIYAIKHDGTLIADFPYNAYPLEFDAEQHVLSIRKDGDVLFLLPVPGIGHVSFSPDSGISWENSLNPAGSSQSGILAEAISVTPSMTPYIWYYPDQEGNVFIHSRSFWFDEILIPWNGFRNGEAGSVLFSSLADETPAEEGFSAFVFPNPVTAGQMRVRISDFAEPVTLDIFDINGTRVFSGSYPPNGILVRDILIEGLKLSSGVYVLSVSSGSNKQKVKFAVQK